VVKAATQSERRALPLVPTTVIARCRVTRLAQVGGFSALFLLCLPDAGMAKVASIGECPGSGGGERFDCQCSWRSAPSVSRNVKIGRSAMSLARHW